MELEYHGQATALVMWVGLLFLLTISGFAACKKFGITMSCCGLVTLVTWRLGGKGGAMILTQGGQTSEYVNIQCIIYFQISISGQI
jgi:hypothetical protein